MALEYANETFLERKVDNWLLQRAIDTILESPWARGSNNDRMFEQGKYPPFRG